jgi:hypothetical protein
VALKNRIGRKTMAHEKRRPEPDEAAAYYFGYIDKVPDGDIVAVLEAQREPTLGFLSAVPEETSLHRYAPDKWTMRQVLNHVNDAERLFLFRAFWFARGFDCALPSFDEKIAAAAAKADRPSWASHIEEFLAARGATLAFYRNLPAEAWSRGGIASDHFFTVRAVAYILAGHLVHHTTILRERYL